MSRPPAGGWNTLVKLINNRGDWFVRVLIADPSGNLQFDSRPRERVAKLRRKRRSRRSRPSPGNERGGPFLSPPRRMFAVVVWTTCC